MRRGYPAECPERVELVAIDMGYGHLRPAHALADYLGGAEVLLADQAPLSTPEEQELWHKARSVYELLSQSSRMPWAGGIMGDLLQGITAIPSLYPLRDLSRRTPAVHLLDWAAARGMGQGLAARLQRNNSTLLTTFFGPAVLSDVQGCEKIYCVVTDSDINRIWAPVEPKTTSIRYLVPSLRVRRRLKAYGVAPEQIEYTGYPLPDELVGRHAEQLRTNLRRRLVALDPKGRFLRETRQDIENFLGELPGATCAPPHLVFAVGGAGAQAELAEQFLPSLAPLVRRKKLQVTLVAGLRPEVKDRFEGAIEKAKLQEEYQMGAVSILLREDHTSYFTSFNQLLARTDILWTKPSELTFFGALGLPLLLSSPVGSHERYNARWAKSAGAAIKQGPLRHSGQWLSEMLKDGTFAGAAWSAYMRMPKFGLYRICETVFGSEWTPSSSTLARLQETPGAAKSANGLA